MILNEDDNQENKKFLTLEKVESVASVNNFSSRESHKDEEKPTIEPLHSDFYYKLEALNEKIKIFKEIFYSSTRDDKRDKERRKLRERHRAILFA